MTVETQPAKTYLFILASLLSGLLLMSLSALVAGGGHGTYVPALVLSPVAMIAAIMTGSIGSPSVVLAAIQFPIYAAILSRARAPQARRARLRNVFLGHAITATIAVAAAWFGEAFFP